MSCQVTAAACLESKELNPEDIESELEYREVPTEKAAVKSSRAMKKRHRGRHLAAGRPGEPKELTREYCGSRRKLAAACRKLFRRAAVARNKRNIFRKIRTQGNCRSRVKFSAAGRRMTHSTKVARRRAHDRKRYDQTSVVQETRKERTFGKRRWKGPECNNGIRDGGLKRNYEATSDETTQAQDSSCVLRSRVYLWSSTGRL
jgi:hypothetical protein